jgi:hypothetical protein
VRIEQPVNGHAKLYNKYGPHAAMDELPWQCCIYGIQAALYMARYKYIDTRSAPGRNRIQCACLRDKAPMNTSNTRGFSNRLGAGQEPLGLQQHRTVHHLAVHCDGGAFG